MLSSYPIPKLLLIFFQSIAISSKVEDCIYEGKIAWQTRECHDCIKELGWRDNRFNEWQSCCHVYATLIILVPKFSRIGGDESSSTWESTVSFKRKGHNLSEGGDNFESRQNTWAPSCLSYYNLVAKAPVKRFLGGMWQHWLIQFMHCHCETRDVC